MESTERRPGKQLEDEMIRAALRDLETGLRDLYGSRAPVILAYGSYARGEASDDSDLDLLLLYSDPVDPSLEIERLVPLLADLNLQYQILISVLPVSDSEYREAQGPFWWNIRREGVSMRQRASGLNARIDWET